MRNSKYWDDFERRVPETVSAMAGDYDPPIRRVACFITNKCNFNCKYCNTQTAKNTMTQEMFTNMLSKYGRSAIIHITGGEPSTVKWLYPFVNTQGCNYKFHLNTNAFIMPPAKSIKRLKVSLDSHNSEYWNNLVGKNAFDTVVKNIKKAIPETIVSITYTITKQNYKEAVTFVEFCNTEFPGLYAVFFSIYKGSDRRFVLSNSDADYFFNKVIPKLNKVLDKESASLLSETIDEKIRLVKGIRFKQNCDGATCYLSMSERVFAPDGLEYTCSHLYRDGIYMQTPQKHVKCRYGCNRRLVAFNEEVQKAFEKGENN